MSSNTAAATALLAALQAKDLASAPLADHVSYQSPLSGEPIRGREHVIRFIGAYLPVIKNVAFDRHLSDEENCVATVCRLDTAFGPLPMVYVSRVENGQIVQIQAFYDPRGFLERMGGH